MNPGNYKVLAAIVKSTARIAWSAMPRRRSEVDDQLMKFSAARHADVR
jgi:hypothetical protein